MKYAIVGSRNYSDYLAIVKVLESFDIFNPKHHIVTGCANGVDKIARIVAWVKFFENGTEKRFFYADWKKFGNAAGPMRNEKIIDQCDQVIAFWSGKSPGTKSSINIAYKQKKPVHIFWI